MDERELKGIVRAHGLALRCIFDLMQAAGIIQRPDVARIRRDLHQWLDPALVPELSHVEREHMMRHLLEIFLYRQEPEPETPASDE